MTTESWISLGRIGGSINAEILKGLFEAQGIEVQLYQEAVGKIAYPVNFGLLGDVEIYVKAADQEKAQRLLAEIESELRSPGEEADFPDESAGDIEPTNSGNKT